MNEKLIALLITLFLGIFIGIGAFIALFRKKEEKFIDFTIALAFSVILMLLFTDLLKEVSEVLGIYKFWLFILFLLVGFFLLRILDFFIPDHEEKKMTKKEEKSNLAHIGIVSAIALVIHNIIEGMAVYSTSLTSISSGLILSFGVGCHNIPLGMVVAGTLDQNRSGKKKMLPILFVLMLSTFFGGFLLFLLNGNAPHPIFLGILLSLTIGMLIYICTNELFPRIKKSKNKKEIGYGFFVGIILIIFANIL